MYREGSPGQAGLRRAVTFMQRKDVAKFAKTIQFGGYPRHKR